MFLKVDEILTNRQNPMYDIFQISTNSQNLMYDIFFSAKWAEPNVRYMYDILVGLDWFWVFTGSQGASPRRTESYQPKFE